jgi:hypothetical protein
MPSGIHNLEAIMQYIENVVKFYIRLFYRRRLIRAKRYTRGITGIPVHHHGDERMMIVFEFDHIHVRHRVVIMMIMMGVRGQGSVRGQL